MKIKGITDECFSDYKLPSMYIAFPNCSFKCDLENGEAYCQNSALAREDDIYINKEELLARYKDNNISKAIVLGGLEPFDSEFDLLPFIDCARRQFQISDPIIIYTGYTEEELEEGRFGRVKDTSIQKDYWENIKKCGNIVVKFGRYRPNQEKHYDSILGVWLASNNQYAKEYI